MSNLLGPSEGQKPVPDGPPDDRPLLLVGRGLKALLCLEGRGGGGAWGEKVREGREGGRERGMSPLTSSFCCGAFCTRSGAGCEVGSVLQSEELQLVGDGVGDGCSGER